MQPNYDDEEVHGFLSVPDNDDETVIRGVDMDFLFEDEDVRRCVETYDDEPAYFSNLEGNKLSESGYFPTKTQQIVDPKPTTLPTISQQDVAINWLPLEGQIAAILHILNAYFVDNKVGFDNPTPTSFVGYLFKESTYALFNLMLYIRQEDEKLGLQLIRLHGDAYLTQDLFTQLRQQLLNNGHVSIENDPNAEVDSDEEEFDENFRFPGEESDEEEELVLERDLMMTAPRYLELELDPGLIDYWMYDLTESCYLDQKLHTLMMMAHNSEDLKNLELMLTHSNGKLFEAIMKIMKEEKKSLPMIRSCARILHNIISGAENLSITWDMVKMMCDCLLTWSKDRSHKKFSYTRPVTNSAEIQTDLAAALYQLVEKLDPPPISFTSNMKQSMDKVQMFLNNDHERGLCHPEARGNLEYFVENVSPILCN